MIMGDYSDKDKSGSVLTMTLCVAVLLSAVALIPPFSVNDMQIGRVNVLSPFLSMDDGGSSSSSSSEWIEDGKLMQSSCVTSSAELDTEVPEAMSSGLAECVSGVAPEEDDFTTDARSGSGVEDFGEAVQMRSRFLENLVSESGKRNIRIAFLGDSFIEGDILTSSVRDGLQREYGGEGVGFVPFADPIARYRTTIRQEYEGWTCYNLLRKKSVPEKYQRDFYISGYLSIPSPGAVATFRSGSYKGSAIKASHARILFKNRDYGVMDVVVNSRDTVRYVLEQSDQVQCIDIRHREIEYLSVSFPECRDFVGYGVVFEGDSGVTIDNYGLRSHSGLNLLSTSYEVNSKIGEFQNYDLIVMEYGLNAMQKTVTKYDSYSERLKKVVAYVRKSFPGSAIMLMSVGDVGMKVDGRMVTAPAVPAMVRCQRSVASQCDVSFWNMYQSMGGRNSMNQFVDNGWAGRDYLHINSKGGDRIGTLLLKSMLGVGTDGAAPVKEPETSTI